MALDAEVALALILTAYPAGAETAMPDAIRGIVRAVEQAQIATDLQTRVSKIAFQEGERFRKGDTIVEFDCRKQRAELAASEATLLEMTLTLDKYRMLQRAQAAGNLQSHEQMRVQQQNRPRLWTPTKRQLFHRKKRARRIHAQARRAQFPQANPRSRKSLPKAVPSRSQRR